MAEKLSVVVSAETAAYRKGMLDAQKETDKFRRQIDSLNQRLGKQDAAFRKSASEIKKATTHYRDVAMAARGFLSLFGAASISGIVYLGKSAIDSAQQIGKVADKLGLTTDALQEMRYAAKLTGVEQNTLDMAMQRFSRRIGEAAQGMGELKGTLTQYGIAVRDSNGQSRAAVDVLGDLAETIKNAESDQERLRIAFKAFDSEGAALVNMLKNGRAGLEEFRKGARDAGVVLEEEMIRRAEDLQDKIDTLGLRFKVFWQESVIGAAGFVENISKINGYNELAKMHTEFVKIQKDLETLKNTAPADMTFDMFKSDKAKEILPGDLFDMTKFETRMNFIRDMGEQFQAEIKRLKPIMDAYEKVLFPEQPDAGKQTAPSIPVPKIPKEYEAYIESLQRELELVTAQGDARTALLQAFEQEEAVRKAVAEAQKAGLELSEDEKQAVRDLVSLTQQQKEANEQAAEAEKAAQKANEEQARTMERFRESLKTTNELFKEHVQWLQEMRDTGIITLDEYNRGIEVAAERYIELDNEAKKHFASMGNSIDGLNRDFAGAMANMVTEGEVAFDRLAQSFINDFIRQSMMELANWDVIGGLFSGGSSMTSSFKPLDYYETKYPTTQPQWTPINQSGMREASGSRVVVNVINATGQPTKQSSKSVGNQEIKEIVIGTVATDISSGGAIGRAIKQTYQVNQSTVRR